MRVRVFDDGAGEGGGDKVGDIGVREFAYLWGCGSSFDFGTCCSSYLCIFRSLCFYSLDRFFFAYLSIPRICSCVIKL